jgi:hypothetical protein
VDLAILNYYKSEDDKTFETIISELISKLYTFVTDLKLMWEISGSEQLLVDGPTVHAISLGGNHSYYKNIMRSMLKRSLKLKEVYDRLVPELANESL